MGSHADSGKSASEKNRLIQKIGSRTLSSTKVTVRAASEMNSVVSSIYGDIELDFLREDDPHPCPYLPDRQARNEGFVVADMSPEIYHDFMNSGFRRSGHYLYRPACIGCKECRPIRVLVNGFKHSKSQRRILNRNSGLSVRVQAPEFTEAKYHMYMDYLAYQHNREAVDSELSMLDFLYSSCVLTVEFEFRLQKRVIAVSIADICSRSLSSVYAFFDPDFRHLSLGTFSALQEILYCRQNLIPHYYLGFYVQDCRAMNYKAGFRPNELLPDSGEWISTKATEAGRPKL